jgi:hypothetical protein
MEAYDGFLDVVEIKRPEGGLSFWASTLDHGNDVPSTELTKAVTQATRYIYEVEREANSVKFLTRVGGVKTVCRDVSWYSAGRRIGTTSKRKPIESSTPAFTT